MRDALLLPPVGFAAAVSGAPEVLLLLAVATPLLLAFAVLVPALRHLVPRLLVLAPLPALAAAVGVPRGMSVLVAPYPFRFTLALDGPGALLLGGAALLWTVVGAYACASMRKDPARDAFAIWWALTMAGSFAVFLVADVASFYLAYAVVSFAAFGLVTHDDMVQARRAGNLYLALTVLGEAFLIAAFVMLASGASEANPLIRDAVTALPASPFRPLIIVLLLLGFTMKMGLFPLHVWMPLAHSVAPVPGSAALSGVVVTAGVVGLLRFLPEGVALPGWGEVLTAAGLFTAFYAVAVGVTQTHPKRVLAYSTVSQMGVVGSVIGSAVASGIPGSFSIAAFYAVNHMLLKGAMFLVAGLAMASDLRLGRKAAYVAALLGLSLAGLPFTGGALAKYAIKLVVPSGGAGALLTLSAAGSALIMARYTVLVATCGKACQTPPGVLLPTLALTGLALVFPFGLFHAVTGLPIASAFSAGALVNGVWPVVLGLALAVLLARHSWPLPEVPAGDILQAARTKGAGWAAITESAIAVDAQFRRWQVASYAMIGIAAVLITVLAIFSAISP